eukprot:1156845-Pelagomonas_calceolata.AAC.1
MLGGATSPDSFNPTWPQPASGAVVLWAWRSLARALHRTSRQVQRPECSPAGRADPTRPHRPPPSTPFCTWHAGAAASSGLRCAA